MDTNALIQQAMEFLMEFGPRLLTALGMLIVGYWLAKIVSGLLVRTLNARNIDPTVSNFVGKLLFGTLLAVALIPALGHAGIQTTSVLAALGAAGLAVGLALQGSLSNFAAGVLLIAFRPCRVGDYVEAGGTAGTVESISLFSTMLMTPDNKRIMIPNSRVMSNPITNYNAMPTRRVDLTIGIPYSADIPAALLIPETDSTVSPPSAAIPTSDQGPHCTLLHHRPHACRRPLNPSIQALPYA